MADGSAPGAVSRCATPVSIADSWTAWATASTTDLLKTLGMMYSSNSSSSLMQAAIARAAASGESETYTGHSTGHGPDGAPAAEFRVTWSFKRRS